MTWTVAYFLGAWVLLLIPVGIFVGLRVLRPNRKRYPKVAPTDPDHPTFI